MTTYKVLTEFEDAKGDVHIKDEVIENWRPQQGDAAVYVGAGKLEAVEDPAAVPPAPPAPEATEASYEAAEGETTSSSSRRRGR